MKGSRAELGGTWDVGRRVGAEGPWDLYIAQSHSKVIEVSRIGVYVR